MCTCVCESGPNKVGGLDTKAKFCKTPYFHKFFIQKYVKKLRFWGMGCTPNCKENQGKCLYRFNQNRCKEFL